jgi:hypothetical protein
MKTLNASEKQQSYIDSMYNEVCAQIDRQLVVEKSTNKLTEIEKMYRYTSIEKVEQYCEEMKIRLARLIELNDAKRAIEDYLKPVTGYQKTTFFMIEKHLRRISKKITEAYDLLIDEDDK